ncbi:hypothetical protein [Micromonospora sp. U21]|uniref:hypothetical protein n=1 Tax=Micromonospora sp. U21 TaxID=2824899 RepID=UPI001B362852|nr:hypothetical protein [Micromonospora sp. U21]MBQ0902025.1 hypothetical protein [Micromonospora sp. U21]
MIDYRCSGCGQRYAAYLPEHADDRCYLCAAKATWESLPPETQRAIDAAITRGAIPGLLAMREADPPILLPQAMDVLQFRSYAGPGDAPVAE